MTNLRAVLLGVFLLVSNTGLARHMEGRTGFGLALHDYRDTPCLSLRHHMSDYQAAEVNLGFDTASSEKTFILGGKFYQAAHLEENITFYVGLGGFLVSSRAGTATTSSGFEVDGLFGGEFFFNGLPNLGIHFETGIALRTLGGVSFSSIGSGFLGGTIHYYF